MYMTVKKAVEKWGISDRRARILCSEGKISSVIREERSWKLAEIAGLEILLILLSTGISSGTVLKMQPKNILSEMS